MRSLTHLSAAVLVLLATTAAAEAQGTRIGVGIGIAPGAVLGTVSPHVYLPIATGRFRIEPGAAYVHLEDESEDEFGSSESSFSGLRVELGLLYALRQSGGTQAYLGPRIGMARLTERDRFDTNPESSVEQTVWTIAGVVGAEHFLASRFSLGGEAQIGLALAGDEEREPDPGIAGESSSSARYTSALLFVRWYFRDSRASNCRESC